GFIFIPAFIGIIYCTSQVREVRDDDSRTFAAMEQAETAARVARGEAERGVPDAAAASARAEAELKDRTREYEAAKAVTDSWRGRARASGIVLGLMLLVDAALLPGAVRRRRALEAAQRQGEVLEVDTSAVHEGGVGEDPTLAVHSPFTDFIDRISAAAG